MSVSKNTHMHTNDAHTDVSKQHLTRGAWPWKAHRLSSTLEGVQMGSSSLLMTSMYRRKLKLLCNF